MKKLLIIFCLILLPSTVFAEPSDTEFSPNGTTLPESIAPAQNDVQVNTVGSESAGLILTVKRSGTSRLLGGVKVTMTDGTKTEDVTLSDPPKPDGEKIFDAKAGKYKITATRNGYKALENQEFEIKANEDVKLNISLEALSGIGNPEQDYQAMLMASMLARMNSINGGLNNPLGGQWTPVSQGGYTNTQTGQWSPVNPQTYPGQGQWIPVSQGGYTNTQTGQWSPVIPTSFDPTISQNSYLLSNNQDATIPLIVKIIQGSFLNTITNISIIDPLLNNNSITLASSNSQFSSIMPLMNNDVYRSGCLRPNSRYILRVYNNQMQLGQPPYQDFNFNTGTYGTYVHIAINPPQSVAFGGTAFINPQFQTLPLQSRTFDLPVVNCPSNLQNGIYDPATQANYNPAQQVVYNPSTGTYTTIPSSQPAYTTTTWTDPTVFPANFGNYHVAKNNLGNYYLESNLDPRDVRVIKFVQNKTSNGGLAFIPAESGLNTYSAQWYITTYTRDNSARISSCRSYLSSLFSLPEFAKLPATRQTELRNSLSFMDSAPASTKFGLCTSYITETKTYLQSVGATSFPAFTPVDENVQVNLTKFSRVNLTPEEYQTTIGGEILTNFNNPL